MIVKSVAPLRIGLAGGGSDISPFCDIYGSAVVNAAINMFVYCTIRQTNDEIIFKSSDLNVVSKYSPGSEISLSEKLKLHHGVYRHIIENYNDGKQIPIWVETYSEAPMGSGIGSSSTLVVAMIRAYGEWLGIDWKPEEIAAMAYRIERVELALPGGRQDQYSAAFGGLNFMEFKGDKSEVSRINVSQEMLDELLGSLFIYYTGASRNSSLIIGDQIRNTELLDAESLVGMHGLKECAYLMRRSLEKGDINEFVKNIELGWKYKKMTSSYITNPKIEQLIKYIKDIGALAVKISGAGGGGFLTVICNAHERKTIIELLNSKGGECIVPVIENRGVFSWKDEAG